MVTSKLGKLDFDRACREKCLMVTSKLDKLDFDRTTGACLARATGACLEDIRSAGVPERRGRGRNPGGLRAKRKGEEYGLERDLWKSKEDLVWRGTYRSLRMTCGSLRAKRRMGDGGEGG